MAQAPASYWNLFSIAGSGTAAFVESSDAMHTARRPARIYFPRPGITLPIELKRELSDMVSSDVARQLKRRKASEDDVLEDFEASRKRRRATRRRR